MNAMRLVVSLFVASIATSTSAAIVSPTFTFGGNNYFVISDNSWTLAEAEAISLGGHLVTINSLAENIFLNTTFPDAGRWIGFNDSLVEGTFVWSSGEAVTYTNWNVGEPSNSGGNEDFGLLRVDGFWNDLGSTAVRQGIVEIPSVPESGSSVLLLGLSMCTLIGTRRRFVDIRGGMKS
jgi:hypothetical protein